MYFFYHYDIRGSVTSIVRPDGTLIEGYTYDEFGNKKTTEYDENGNPVLNPNNEVFKNEVTFTGSITDMSTGLQYMNARYYDSTNGRFLSQDTYSGNPYEPWTQHLYSYCGNNPTNFIDPTGHRPIMGDDPSVERWTRKNGEWVYLGLTERGKKNEKRKQESQNIEKPPVITEHTLVLETTKLLDQINNKTEDPLIRFAVQSAKENIDTVVIKQYSTYYLSDNPLDTNSAYNKLMSLRGESEIIGTVIMYAAGLAVSGNPGIAAGLAGANVVVGIGSAICGKDEEGPIGGIYTEFSLVYNSGYDNYIISGRFGPDSPGPEIDPQYETDPYDINNPLNQFIYY
jgi:RHS repeat-associated protein